MKRAEVLEKAMTCVCGEREQDYGTPEDNFSTIGGLWSIYLKAAHPKLKVSADTITAKDVAVMMSLLKVARIATGSSPDSFVDLAGYAACAGEIATQPKPTVHCGDCRFWSSNGKTGEDPFGKQVKQGDCCFGGAGKKVKKELTSETNGCVLGEKR